jgi:hypothetical protein
MPMQLAQVRSIEFTQRILSLHVTTIFENLKVANQTESAELIRFANTLGLKAEFLMTLSQSSGLSLQQVARLLEAKKLFQELAEGTLALDNKALKRAVYLVSSWQFGYEDRQQALEVTRNALPPNTKFFLVWGRRSFNVVVGPNRATAVHVGSVRYRDGKIVFVPPIRTKASQTDYAAANLAAKGSLGATPFLVSWLESRDCFIVRKPRVGTKDGTLGTVVKNSEGVWVFVPNTKTPKRLPAIQGLILLDVLLGDKQYSTSVTTNPGKFSVFVRDTTAKTGTRYVGTLHQYYVTEKDASSGQDTIQRIVVFKPTSTYKNRELVGPLSTALDLAFGATKWNATYINATTYKISPAMLNGRPIDPSVAGVARLDASGHWQVSKSTPNTQGNNASGPRNSDILMPETPLPDGLEDKLIEVQAKYPNGALTATREVDGTLTVAIDRKPIGFIKLKSTERQHGELPIDEWTFYEGINPARASAVVVNPRNHKFSDFNKTNAPEKFSEAQKMQLAISLGVDPSSLRFARDLTRPMEIQVYKVVSGKQIPVCVLIPVLRPNNEMEYIFVPPNPIQAEYLRNPNTENRERFYRAAAEHLAKTTDYRRLSNNEKRQINNALNNNGNRNYVRTWYPIENEDGSYTIYDNFELKNKLGEYRWTNDGKKGAFFPAT